MPMATGPKARHNQIRGISSPFKTPIDVHQVAVYIHRRSLSLMAELIKFLQSKKAEVDLLPWRDVLDTGGFSLPIYESPYNLRPTRSLRTLRAAQSKASVLEQREDDGSAVRPNGKNIL